MWTAILTVILVTCNFAEALQGTNSSNDGNLIVLSKVSTREDGYRVLHLGADGRVTYRLSSSQLAKLDDKGEHSEPLSYAVSEVIATKSGLLAAGRDNVFTIREGKWVIPPLEWGEQPIGTQDAVLHIFRDNNSLYAYRWGTLFRSLDDGQTWSSHDLPGNCGVLDRLSSEGDLIAAVCDDEEYTETPKRTVFKSTDGGETWNSIASPYGSAESSTNPTVVVRHGQIYVTGDGKLHLSTADGKWELINVPLGPYGSVSSVVQTRQSIFAVTSGGLLRLGDKDWIRIDSIDHDYVRTSDDEMITLDGNSDLAYSRDNGLHWVKLPAPPISLGQLSFNSGRIVESTDSQVYQLTIGSGTPQWSPVPQVLPSKTIFSCEDVLLATGNALWLSVDGRHWQQTNVPAPVGIPIAENGNFLIASYSENGALYESRDCKAWRQIHQIPRERPVLTVHDKRLYILKGGSSSQPPIVPSIALSDDGGRTWSPVDNVPWLGAQQVLAINVSSDNAIYVATSHAIFKRTSAGTWENVTTGPLASGGIQFFTIDDDVLYATTKSTFAASVDGGRTWISAAHGQWETVDGVFAVGPKRFVLLADTGVYEAKSRALPRLSAAMATIHIPALDLAGAEISHILIDGVELPGSTVGFGDGDLILRDPKPTLTKISDGLHEMQIRARRGVEEISRTAYIYKELTKASFFKPYDKSYALIIAASGKWDGKEFTPLTVAIPQAQEVARVLGAYGFEVRTLFEEDATVLNIEAYLADVGARMTTDDRLIFYFSGHGVTLPGAQGDLGYLLTYPATLSSVRRLGLPMVRMQSEYADLPAKHIAFVLDACFSGLALEKDPVPTDVAKFLRYEQLAEFTKDKARDIMTAGDKSQPALDVNGGIFTQAFLEGIQGAADYGHSGVITVDELYVYIRNKVMASAALHKRQQTPQLGHLTTYGSGKFVFYK
jgi:photosystem II stability/assembly factor-like uncharacterized protein